MRRGVDESAAARRYGVSRALLRFRTAFHRRAFSTAAGLKRGAVRSDPTERQRTRTTASPAQARPFERGV
jgi:hypothetical protein